MSKTVNIPQLVQSLRESFDSGITKPIDYRIEQLRCLYNLVTKEQDRLCEALYKDLKKAKQEAITTELLVVRGAVVHMLNHIYEYSEPKAVYDKPIFFLGDTVQVRKVPHGVVTVLLLIDCECLELPNSIRISSISR